MALPLDTPLAMCVECEDQEAAVLCEQCDEHFCRPCFQMQHRKGKRRLHQIITLGLGEMMPKPAGEAAGVAAAAAAAAGGHAAVAAAAAPAQSAGELHVDNSLKKTVDGAENGAENGGADADGEGWEEVGARSKGGRAQAEYRFIPVRLTSSERDLFSVLEGTLQVSEYTDHVDTHRWGKEQRMCDEFDEVLRELVGLLCCNDFRQGSRKAAAERVQENQDFFRTIFEIGRRYKIMNPEKMRSTYGKLMWILQDSSISTVARHIRMDVVSPIKTVLSVAREAGAEAMLADPDFTSATNEISPSLSKAEIDVLRKKKAEAMGTLVERYKSAAFPAAQVERIIFSVADSRTYNGIATAPITAMIHYLKTYFPVSSPTKQIESLDISYGKGGSMLSHSHPTQYRFVLQTLSFWLKMCSRMFQLWSAADEDMLAGMSYRLCNTGQGLNRVQGCPTVSRTVNGILREVQSEVVGSWVGLSVVHLGDRDVPNALVFIDKYTQIPRILAPIVQTVSRLEKLAEDAAIKAYFENKFGGVNNLRQFILRDFFRHGFNGSGDDGGSCIDGRLTSAWNWCSRLEKKSYYRVFLLAGFTGFDGDWRAG